ncbi:unnamed protein product, partial [Tilletia controversa]
EFCERRQFADGLVVSEGKVLLWLQEDIVPTGNKNKAKRKIPAEEVVEEVAKDASTSAPPTRKKGKGKGKGKCKGKAKQNAPATATDVVMEPADESPVAAPAPLAAKTIDGY